MKNTSVSDFVAASMDAALKSKEYKTLFNTQYKFASSDKMCAEHGEVDSCSADDNDAKAPVKFDPEFGARPVPGPSEDSNYADDENDARKKKKEKEEEEESSSDESSADDDMTSSAFDVAIDSLLTASAALDSVGMEKGSSLSLKLASLVVEAKKKESKDSKDKKDSQSAKDKEKAMKEKEKAKAAKEKEKEKKDLQSAKDKAAKEKEKEKAAKEKAAKEMKEKAAKEKAAKEKASKK